MTACRVSLIFFCTAPAPTEIYTLSLHDALPISTMKSPAWLFVSERSASCGPTSVVAVSALLERRSEEHTSELQSRGQIVCRLLLVKKNVMVVWAPDARPRRSQLTSPRNAPHEP